MWVIRYKLGGVIYEQQLIYDTLPKHVFSPFQTTNNKAASFNKIQHPSLFGQKINIYTNQQPINPSKDPACS